MKLRTGTAAVLLGLSLTGCSGGGESSNSTQQPVESIKEVGTTDTNKTPIVSTQVVQTPTETTQVVVQPPIITPPAVQPPKITTPVVDTPVIDKPVVNTPVIKPPKITTPVVDTPVITNPVNNLTLTIKQLDQLEGSQARIEVSLPEASSITQRFDYKLLPSTALAGRDYKDAVGQIEFKAGETKQLLTIALLSDKDSEKDELFLLELSGDTLAGKVQGTSLKIVDQPLLTSSLSQVHLNQVVVAQSQATSFGQFFTQGEITDGQQLLLMNGQQQSLPTQVDVKARHPDGSIRHAVISTVKAKADASTDWFVVKQQTPQATSKLSLDPLVELQKRKVDANLSLKLADGTYQVQLQTALAAALKQKRSSNWLQGPVVNEWLFTAPLVDAQLKQHPHLTARFELRIYQDYQPVRLSVTLENNWTYVANPSNQEYDLKLSFTGQPNIEEQGLLHNHHSRWRKVLWSDTTAELQATPDLVKLLKSGAVPSYDSSLSLAEATLKSYADAFNSADAKERFGLMGTGLLNYKMGTTGARPEIGPLPAWTAAYLISGDSRARKLMLEQADLAGSWPIHYRDEKTDLPVSVLNYPYITLLGNKGDTYNPDTQAYEALPTCDLKTLCQSINRRFWSKRASASASELASYSNEPDSAHQPSQAYIPYLITGDYFYLEEMQFWTAFNLLQNNPEYRQKDLGIVHGQVRGMAWDLRALGEVAYLTPDTHPLKASFKQILANNARYFKTTYADHSADYPLGYVPGLAYGFVISPWMDDFFTWSVGALVNQGFSDWQPVLDWKARFPVGRMMDPGFCWVMATAYHLNARPGDETRQKVVDETYYQTFGDIYKDLLSTPAYSSLNGKACGSPEMANALTEMNKTKAAGQFYVTMQVGEMLGYDGTYSGYSANLQPALAVATASSQPQAKAAWQRFIQRPKQANGYEQSPQFAIVPLAP